MREALAELGMPVREYDLVFFRDPPSSIGQASPGGLPVAQVRLLCPNGTFDPDQPWRILVNISAPDVRSTVRHECYHMHAFWSGGQPAAEASEEGARAFGGAS